MTENSEMGRVRPRPPTPPPVAIASSVTGGPPVPSGQVIERPRLLERLAQAVDDAAVTVVSAPAGSGKTVLAAQWAESRPGPAVAWTSVTDRDDNPRAFWWHVRTALGRAGAVDTGEGVQLFPGADEADWLVHQLLRNGRPVVLVLDAAHRLRHRAVFDELARLLDGAAGVLRLLVTTRHDPPLPLHRYRLAGTVAELGADELAFTRPELRTLLEAHGVNRADEVVEELLGRTEGWVAGARIGAMALQPGTSGADLVDLASRYLIPEVFDVLGEPEQRLLLRVSVVDEVDRGLAVALTGQPDAERLLVGLSRRNAFVQPVSGRNGSYRLHPLFREALARQRSPGTPDHADLHRRTSEWFAADRQLLPAVDHAIAAGDWERAAACTIEIDGLVDLLVPTPAGSTLAARLSPVPVPVGVTGSADVRLVLAALALHHGDVALARLHLARCEWGAEGGERAMWAAVVSTSLAASDADADATLRAASVARQHGCDRVGDASAALVRHVEGTAQLLAGDLDTAGTILATAVAAADASGRVELRSRSTAMLALVEACRGQLCRADELAEMVDRLVGDGDAEPPAALDLARAWVALDRQDLSRAQHALYRARRTRGTTDTPMLRPISVLLAARLKRDHGDGASARVLLQQAAPRADWLRQSLDAEAAAVGLPTSGVEAEEQRGRPSPAGVPGPAHPPAQVEQLLGRARVHLLQGDAHACRAEVAHALAIARDERLRRPFTHAAPEIRALIRSDRELRTSANWLRPDRSSRPEDRIHPEAPAPLVEMLSERELEVLRHLSALLTTEEIAAEMFISANTVRTHVRRILGKLSVSRRHEAVRRARELRLV